MLLGVLPRSTSSIRDTLRKRYFIIDMDGVIYHGDHLLPGVVEFIDWLRDENKRFLFLTNSSHKTPQELQAKLAGFGIDVPAEVFHTSAISTAMFLDAQHPGGTAFVIGDRGLRDALHDVGYRVLPDKAPAQSPDSVHVASSRVDYVIIGETMEYNFELLEQAVNYVKNGARLLGTNCDVVDKSISGVVPACGSLVAPIERSTGKQAYFIGRYLATLKHELRIEVT